MLQSWYLSILYSFNFDLHVDVPYVCVCVCICRCFFMLNSWVHVAQSLKHISKAAVGCLYIPAVDYVSVILHVPYVYNILGINNR